MGELKMLMGKDAKRVKKLLGISDDEFEKFKDMARENDERNKKRANSRLIVDEKLPQIFIKKGLEKEFAEFHNDNIAGNMVSDHLILKETVKEGYLNISFEDFLKINYPDEMEVVRLIQEYSRPELLEQLKEMESRINSVYNKIIVKFKVDKGTAVELEMYEANRNLKMTSAIVDEDLFKSLDEVEISEIQTEFEFNIDVQEDEDSFGYEIREDIVSNKTVPSMTVFSQMLIRMLNEHSDSFLVTKENLNEKIKKDTNEGIQLHRQIKQHLKKSKTPIYYIDKIM